jgi:hypothetical protein
MITISGGCVVCGEPLAFEVPETLPESHLVAPQCLSCLDQQRGSGSELVFQLPEQPAGAVFALGRVTITRAALAALVKSGENAVELLARHAGLGEQVRVLSTVQTSGGGKLSVCTDIAADGRAETVLLSATESRAVLGGLPKSA